MDRLAKLIKGYRLARDMSLRDVGTAASVHYSYIAKLERGTVHNPSREVVCRIAAALDAPVDEFEIAAGYIPKGKGPITASWRDDCDTPLSPDVQQAVYLILEKLRQKHRDGGKNG